MHVLHVIRTMTNTNTDGVEDPQDLDTTTADTTVSEPSSDEKASTDNLEEKPESEDLGEEAEESYEELLEKLKNDGISLNKIKRFQKLNDKAKLATELEAKIKELESSKAEVKEEKKPEEQKIDKSGSDYSNDFKEIDDVLETIDVDDTIFNDLEKLKEGDFNSWKDMALLMYKPIRKAILRDLTRVRDVGRQKEEAQAIAQKEATEKYYNEFETEIKDVFTDDGKLDEKAYGEYKAALLEHYNSLSDEDKKKPFEQKFRSKYLRAQSRKSIEPEKTEDNPVAGRTTNRSSNADDYVPGTGFNGI